MVWITGDSRHSTAIGSTHDCWSRTSENILSKSIVVISAAKLNSDAEKKPSDDSQDQKKAKETAKKQTKQEISLSRSKQPRRSLPPRIKRRRKIGKSKSMV
jgi:hypothetical protein